MNSSSQNHLIKYDEFNNISQRYAICFKKWEDKKKAASAIIESKDDEVAYFMEDNN